MNTKGLTRENLKYKKIVKLNTLDRKILKLELNLLAWASCFNLI